MYLHGEEEIEEKEGTIDMHICSRGYERRNERSGKKAGKGKEEDKAGYHGRFGIST